MAFGEDIFGDGGAFPEIHVAQYPLGMGKKSSANTLTRTAAIPENKTFQPADMERPSEDETTELALKTAAILLKQGNTIAPQSQATGKPTFIRYTPKQEHPEHNSGHAQRIIRLVESQTDVLEPPKFRHKKMPKGPPSPPVPVQHSPPRKLTVKDMAEWKIPPCISNWKNPKGYTIPLDKRLAADGRGLQETTINDGFAKLSEALYIAERNAREEVEGRMKLAKQLAAKQKQKKEEDLRRLAMLAREERARGTTGLTGVGAGPTPAETPEEMAERLRRNEEREERRREIEREKRLENKDKKGKPKERDISEKIALGQASQNKSTESMYDTRLFNQSSGIGSGFRDEEDYSIYDKALFKTQTSNYRPEKERISAETDLASKTESFAKGLEFEKDDDPFGLGQILTEAKTSKRSLDVKGSESSSKKPRV